MKNPTYIEVQDMLAKQKNMSKNGVTMEWMIKNGFQMNDSGVWERKSAVSVKPKPKVRHIAPKGHSEAILGINEILKRTYVFDVTPMGKPSFQKSDKWRTFNNHNPRMRQRPVVTKWIEFKGNLKTQAKNQGFVMPDADAVLTFFIPMPDSWSKKKKQLMNGSPHKQKPDLDNILKGFFDSVCEEDSYIYQYSPQKRWGTQGKIVVTI